MKAGVENAFVAGELIVRTGRHLVVLTLPLVFWLAGQDYPAQACLLGRCSVARLCLPSAGLGPVRERISTSLPFRKMHLTKATTFIADRG
jgi:hypothetical protein